MDTSTPDITLSRQWIKCWSVCTDAQADLSVVLIYGINRFSHDRANLHAVLNIADTGYKFAVSWENLFMPHANNKAADQPAHPHSQISAFVVRCLDSIVSLVPIFAIWWLTQACVAEQAGLSPAWSQTPKDSFSQSEKSLPSLWLQCPAVTCQTASWLQYISGTHRLPSCPPPLPPTKQILQHIIHLPKANLKHILVCCLPIAPTKIFYWSFSFFASVLNTLVSKYGLLLGQGAKESFSYPSTHPENSGSVKSKQTYF